MASAYTQWEGKTMKIWEAEVEDVVETIDTHEPGTITEVTKHGFKVQTGKGRLAIKSLQIPGKKRMEADAFPTRIPHRNRKQKLARVYL